MKIGLPKGLLYYRYEVLWKSFLQALHIPFITSEESQYTILDAGKRKCVDETCLALKLYIGHIASLKDQCDAILVPRIFSLEKGYQVCTNFNCLYDLVHTLYPELSIFYYNVDVQRHQGEMLGFVKLGKQLGVPLLEAYRAYQFAKEKQLAFLKQREKTKETVQNINHTKILLVGHAYNLRDAFIGKQISSYLEKQNITVVYSDEMPLSQIEESKKISSKVHWTMNKELLAAFAYYQDVVDGIIIISAFPCGPDSLTNEMMMRRHGNHKVLLLTFEDLTSNSALITRLESFLDMLKGGIHL